MMIGRPLTVIPGCGPARRDHSAVVRAISGLRRGRFGPVDLEVRKGEIVGIAGAEGNGQVPFLRALAGAEPAVGTASCDGVKLDTRSPAGPLRAGVVLLSGDRRGEALFPVLSVRANATIQVLRRLARGGIVRRGRERQAIAGLVERLRVRMASSEQPVQSLSGGNQQKVSLIRPFLRRRRGSSRQSPRRASTRRRALRHDEAWCAKATRGATVLVQRPLELVGLCDRVVVMSRGRIVEEIPRQRSNGGSSRRSSVRARVSRLRSTMMR